MIDILVESLPLLILGAKNTFLVTIVSVVIGLPIGFIFGLLRMSKIRSIQKISLIYIEVWRAVPFIVELLLIFFVLPPILNKFFKFEISAFEAMVIGSVLWTSANSAEVFRAAIQSLPYGQTEAAISLGMSYYQRMRLIILPQALKFTLPPLVGIFTLVLKGTAIGFIIDYRELIRMGQITIERVYMQNHVLASFEIYTIIMILYFCMCYPLSLVSLFLERRIFNNKEVIA
jgi:polar amino acid transport system permease protein